MMKPIYKLLDWIPKQNLRWENLCLNPKAIFVLEQNVHCFNSVCWNNLCKNPDGLSIIETNIEKLSAEDFKELCKREDAMHIINKNIDKVDDKCWLELCTNPSAVSIIENHFEEVIQKNNLDDVKLLLCENPKAIRIVETIEDCLDSKCWLALCSHDTKEFAILIERNIEKLGFECWVNILTNPHMIHMLEKYFDTINEIDSRLSWSESPNHLWWFVSLNPNAIHFIEKNLDKINSSGSYKFYRGLCRNPNPNALPIIEKNVDKLGKSGIADLCERTDAFYIIEQNIDKLDGNCWWTLCRNPNAQHILEKNIENVPNESLWALTRNKELVPIVEQKINEIDYGFNNWLDLCKTENGVDILQNNLDRLDDYFWEALCNNIEYNLNAIRLIDNNIQLIDEYCFHTLVFSSHAVQIIEKNIERLDDHMWYYLCRNPNAVHLIEKHIDNLHPACWVILCNNPNPDALGLIQKHINIFKRFMWHPNIKTARNFNEIASSACIVKNNKKMKIKKKNSWKSGWDILSENPSILTLDYEAMRHQCMAFAEELAEYVFHPERIERMSIRYNINFYSYLNAL